MTLYSLVDRFLKNVGICLPSDVVSNDHNIRHNERTLNLIKCYNSERVK